MTEDSIRVPAGRPSTFGDGPASGHTSGGHTPARGGRRGLPVPTELLVLLIAAIAVLVAAAVDDGFGASAAWAYVTALGVAYIFSRGLVKRGHGDHDGL